MATFVLVPGAGGAAWYWHRVIAELEAAGAHRDSRRHPRGRSRPRVAGVRAARRGCHRRPARRRVGRAVAGRLHRTDGRCPHPGADDGARQRDGPAARGRRLAPGGMPPGRARHVGLQRWPTLAIPSSISSATSCTTCRPRSRPREPASNAGRRTRRSASRAISSNGRTSRSRLSSPATTGSSLRSSSAASPQEPARLPIAVDEIDGGHLVAMSNPVGLHRPAHFLPLTGPRPGPASPILARVSAPSVAELRERLDDLRFATPTRLGRRLRGGAGTAREPAPPTLVGQFERARAPDHHPHGRRPADHLSGPAGQREARRHRRGDPRPPGGRRRRRDRLGQDHPAAQDLPRTRPRHPRHDRAHPAAPARRSHGRATHRRRTAHPARRRRRLHRPVHRPGERPHAGQADDRRHPARRDPARPPAARATTRSSSTRRTSAA